MIAPYLIGFENIPQTIPHYCFESFTRHNKRDALAFKIDDAWSYLSGHAVDERVKSIARALAAMGVKPLLNLDMRLGEGSGAALGISMAEAACKVLSEMATFSEAGVNERE